MREHIWSTPIISGILNAAQNNKCNIYAASLVHQFLDVNDVQYTDESFWMPISATDDTSIEKDDMK